MSVITKEKVRKESDRKRDRILQRDKNRCLICKSKSHLEVHHILAVYKGGTEEDENLITLCTTCHSLAPETGFEDFAKFQINPYQNVMHRMMESPGVKKTFIEGATKFYEDSTSEYVEKEFITAEQRQKILLYELAKLKIDF